MMIPSVPLLLLLLNSASAAPTTAADAPRIAAAMPAASDHSETSATPAAPAASERNEINERSENSRGTGNSENSGGTGNSESSAAPGPILTLEEAVKIGLAAQPTLRQAQALSRAAEARALGARAPLLPQVSANLGYQRSTSNFTARPGSLPDELDRDDGESSFDTTGYFSGGVNASQLVWDFGQTRSRWRAAQETAQAQGHAERTTRQDTVLGIRNAYFGTRGARALLKVAEETLANQRRHLQNAQGFYEVGTRPRLDLVQARAEVANAEVQRIQAENAYRNSKLQLNQAMGREGPAEFEVADDTLPAVEGEEAAPGELIEQALAARPEFAQIDSQLRAQQLQVRSLGGGYWPTLGVSTGVNFGGAELGALAWNWSAQATLNWSLFQGFQTRSQISEAEANLEALAAQRDALRQRVEVEVEQLRLAIAAAKSVLTASEQVLENANERLLLAEGRYQTGSGSIIELGDAQVAATNAAGQRVQAEYQLSAARAQLLWALGRE